MHLSPHAPPSPDPRVFAALGDPTRLLLLDRLRVSSPRSISALAEGTHISRQAVTKHLDVLAGAGLVRAERRGREQLYRLDPAPITALAGWAAEFAAGWQSRLDRLEALLTTSPPPPESDPCTTTSPPTARSS